MEISTHIPLHSGSNVAYWNTANTTIAPNQVVLYQTVHEDHSITEDQLTVRKLTPFTINQIRQVVEFQLSGTFTRLKTEIYLEDKYIGVHYTIDPLTDEFINAKYEKEAAEWLEKTMTPEKRSTAKRS